MPWPNVFASQPTGNVPASYLDDNFNAAAPLASPALTGVPTAPTPAAADNSTTIATTAFAQSLLSANFRTRLINGDFSVDQRNSGASQAVVAADPAAYTADRWYATCAGANVTGEQVAGTAPRPFAYQFTGAAANSGVVFGQRIESLNVNDLVNISVIGSGYFSSSSATTLTWTAYYANAVDNFSAQTQIATGTLTISATPTLLDFTFNAGSSAANGIALQFSVSTLPAAATLTFEDVQLSPGVAVSDFSYLTISERMALCQRYYETGLGTIAIAYIPSPGWNMANSFGFKATKRTTPTITTTFGTLSTTNVNGVVLYASMTSAPEQNNLTFTATAEL